MIKCHDLLADIIAKKRWDSKAVVYSAHSLYPLITSLNANLNHKLAQQLIDEIRMLIDGGSQLLYPAEWRRN